MASNVVAMDDDLLKIISLLGRSHVEYCNSMTVIKILA